MITIDLTCLSLPRPCRILDIGCGSGRHLAAAYALDQALVIGVDTQVADLKQACNRLKFHRDLKAHGKDSQWQVAAANISHLPFSDHSFDLVICSEVLEHLPQLPPAIDELARVLCPGGHLAISVPRPWPEAICWLLSRRYHTTPGGHVRIVNLNHLKKKLRDRGLHHWRTHWAHSLHSPFWWLKCIVGVDRDELLPVKLYHRLLVWDIMSRSKITRVVEHWLNPLMGKSTVIYFKNRKRSDDEQLKIGN